LKRGKLPFNRDSNLNKSVILARSRGGNFSKTLLNPNEEGNVTSINPTYKIPEVIPLTTTIPSAKNVLTIISNQGLIIGKKLLRLLI
jgi:hypothetical protein